MKITFKTDLPTNEKETLDKVIKIIKYASLELDIDLEVTTYGTMAQTNLIALNTIALNEILDDQTAK